MDTDTRFIVPPNTFSLEPADLTDTWVHLNLMFYEEKYLNDNFFTTSIEDELKSLTNL